MSLTIPATVNRRNLLMASALAPGAAMAQPARTPNRGKTPGMRAF